MSRYIDADALKKSIDDCDICNICPDKNVRCDYDCDFPDCLTPKWETLIDNAPSIDIVRCKECKHCSKDRIKWSVKGEDGNWIDTKCNLCRRTKLEVNPDDFCSYGEREGE